MDYTPDQRCDCSGEEEVASIDNGIAELRPETYVICTFITDDIHFIRATQEPADTSEQDEAEHDAEGLDSFAAIILPVVDELYNDYTKGNQNNDTEEDIVPYEEGVSETRNVQHFSRNLVYTCITAELEHRDEHDTQQHEA